MGGSRTGVGVTRDGGSREARVTEKLRGSTTTGVSGMWLWWTRICVCPPTRTTVYPIPFTRNSLAFPPFVGVGAHDTPQFIATWPCDVPCAAFSPPFNTSSPLIEYDSTHIQSPSQLNWNRKPILSIVILSYTQNNIF